MKVLPLGALLVLLSAAVQGRPSSGFPSEAVQDDDLREESGVADVTPAPSLKTQSETGTIEHDILAPPRVQKEASVEVDSNHELADESGEEDSSSEEDVAAIDLKADELKDDIDELLSEIEVRWGKKGGYGHKKMGHGHKKGHQKKGGHHKKGHKKGHDHKKTHDKCHCSCHHKKEHKKHEHKHKHDHKHDDKEDDKKEDKKEHKHTHKHKHSKNDGGD